MTSEYNSDGYEDIRTYVYNNHNWIGIYDDTSTELLRWDLNNNSNVEENSGPSTNPIKYTIRISGSDLESAGFTLPVTVKYGQLYDTDTSATPLATDNFEDSSGTDTTATLGVSDDVVEVIFTNEWPQV